MVSLLQEEKVDFDYYDILGDDEVRQGLKTYSNWPTFPQLYVKGELLGGLDIIKVCCRVAALAAVLQSWRSRRVWARSCRVSEAHAVSPLPWR